MELRPDHTYIIHTQGFLPWWPPQDICLPVAYLWVLKSPSISQSRAWRYSPIPPLPTYIQGLLLKNEMPYFTLWRFFIPHYDRRVGKLTSSERTHYERPWCAWKGGTAAVSFLCLAQEFRRWTPKAANCAFPLKDYPTEIQTPWWTVQRTTTSERAATRSEERGVQTVVFQSTVAWLLSC